MERRVDKPCDEALNRFDPRSAPFNE